MSNVTSTTISTKVNATDKEATETKLTLNWEGMTPEDIRALAQQALIVKVQAGFRRAKAIPGEATINVVEHKVGSRAPRQPVNVVDLLKALSPEDLAKALASAGINLA